jgi:hypothetical protein
MAIRYLTRYKTALREHNSLRGLIENLSLWFTTWKSGDFEDGWVYATEDNRERTIQGLEQKLRRLSTILNRESASLPRSAGASGLTDPDPEAHHEHQMILAGRLEMNYEPAGHLREDGRRHDNDFADIQLISIPPTQNEMLCPIRPFLPANIPGAPHHREVASMERLLDIQFRLLREELT